jgi:hypothetical protein
VTNGQIEINALKKAGKCSVEVKTMRTYHTVIEPFLFLLPIVKKSAMGKNILGLQLIK